MANDVSTALPDLRLKENTIITVTLDDPNAVITKMTLHGWQDTDGGAGGSVEVVLNTQPILVAGPN